MGLIAREFTFDSAAYSVDAIQRAAYRLADRLSLDLHVVGDVLECTVHAPEQTEAELESLLSDFRREVVDQALRERIRAETEAIRNVVLAFAFSNTGLSEQ